MNFNYQISEQNYLEAHSTHARNCEKNWHVTIWYMLIVITALVPLVFIVSQGYGDYVMLITFPLGSIFIYLNFINKKHLKKEYENNAFIKLPIALSVTDKGCLQVGDDYQVLLRWENIYRYVESDKYWLLYTSPCLMHIIPKSSLGETEWQQFSDILKQHIGGRGKMDETMCNLNARKANNQK